MTIIHCIHVLQNISYTLFFQPRCSAVPQFALKKMQLFLKFGAATTTLNVEPNTDIRTLKSMIQARERNDAAICDSNGLLKGLLMTSSLIVCVQDKEGIPAQDQVLICNAKVLEEYCVSLHSAGVTQHSTVHLSCRLRGGKPVKVKMMTAHLPCGPEVTIDIDANASKDEIKQKLAPVTGVPAEHQKVMLSGINQIVMGDKR